VAGQEGVFRDTLEALLRKEAVASSVPDR